MTRIVIETKLRAPIELCFDLARDVGVHAQSASFSSERVVAPGRTAGLLQLGDLIAFEGRHFGLKQRFVARITALNRPRRFDDEMVQGSFKWLRHIHAFEFTDGVTTMRDTLEWEPPLGVIGRLLDSLLLCRHMHRLVSRKQQGLKCIAEKLAGREISGP